MVPGVTDFDLASDPQAFLRHLDGQLDALIRASAALDAAAGPGDATDPTGAVRVEFGPGGQLAAIRVHPDWERVITADDLTTVINDTLVRARDGEEADADPGTELTDEQVAAIREREEAETLAALQAVDGDELAEAASAVPAQLDALNAELTALLARAEEVAVDISDEPVEPSTVTTRSDNDMVAIETVGDTPVRVAIHRRWLSGRSGNILTQCFAEIIDQLAAPSTPADE